MLIKTFACSLNYGGHAACPVGFSIRRSLSTLMPACPCGNNCRRGQFTSHHRTEPRHSEARQAWPIPWACQLRRHRDHHGGGRTGNPPSSIWPYSVVPERCRGSRTAASVGVRSFWFGCPDLGLVADSHQLASVDTSALCDPTMPDWKNFGGDIEVGVIVDEREIMLGR
jgi:hypothetical protein